MEDITTPREQILKKVRAGLLNKFATPFQDVESDTDIFPPTGDPAKAFAENFTLKGGGFIYCHNEFDFHESLIIWMEKKGISKLMVSDLALRSELKSLGLPISEEFEEFHANSATLLSAEALTARNGGLVFSSKNSHRKLLADSNILLVMAKLSALGNDMKHALLTLRNKYGEKQPSLISFMQAPSNKGLSDTQQKRQMILFLVNDLLT